MNLWFGPDLTREASEGFAAILANIRPPRVYRIGCLYVFIILPAVCAVWLLVLAAWIVFLSLIWAMQLIVFVVAFPFALAYALRVRRQEIKRNQAEANLREWYGNKEQ
jgi:membrane protein implicated in regulation of membrane protease activity